MMASIHYKYSFIYMHTYTHTIILVFCWANKNIILCIQDAARKNFYDLMQVVCLYVYIFICMFAKTDVHLSMYLSIYAYMNECMYVLLYVVV